MITTEIGFKINFIVYLTTTIKESKIPFLLLKMILKKIKIINQYRIACSLVVNPYSPLE